MQIDACKKPNPETLGRELLTGPGREDLEEKAGLGGADRSGQPSLSAHFRRLLLGHQADPQPSFAVANPPAEQLSEVELEQPRSRLPWGPYTALKDRLLSQLQHQLLGAPELANRASLQHPGQRPCPGRGGRTGAGWWPHQPKQWGAVKSQRAARLQPAGPRLRRGRRRQQQVPSIDAKERGYHKVHRQALPLQARVAERLPGLQRRPHGW